MAAGLDGQARRRSSRTSKKAGAKAAKQTDDATPTSLLKLPTEIITQITSLLDGVSAAQLARTTRRFTSIATEKLWRDVDLTVSSAPADRPMISPYSFGPRAPKQKSDDVTSRLNLMVKRKIEAILLAGSRARWAKVESLRCLTRQGSVHSLLLLLELTAPNIQRLWMDTGDEREMDIGHPTLDAVSIGCPFNFPALTHVRIGNGSIQSAAFLLHLCQAAPALISLDADLDEITTPAWLEDELFYGLDEDTQIRHLRLAFGSRDTILIPGEGYDDEEVVDHPVLSLVRHSPLTEQFSIQFMDGSDEGRYMFDYLMIAMKDWKALREVYWGAWYGRLEGTNICPKEVAVHDFDSVQRCILEPIHLVNLFQNIPGGSKLEIAYFVTPIRLHPDPSFVPPPIPPKALAKLSQAQHLTSHFADQVCASPLFRHISYGPDIDIDGGFIMFDKLRQIQKSGSLGLIDSYVHGEDELLRVRLLLDVVEVGDVGDDDPPGPPSTATETAFEYYAEDGLDRRTRTFEPLPSAVWQTFTYYKSSVVPLETLEAMREVEGLEKADWEQRRVAVRDETWKVLTDWYDGMVASGVTGDS